MTAPCQQVGAISALEANNENIMREISEMKADVKDARADIKNVSQKVDDLSKAVLTFQQTADYKYVTRKEFEESSRIAWLIKIVFGSTAGLAALAAFLKYVLNAF
jgi:predicted  nucleic acid-binding Zn-ribbon protein